MENNYQLLKPFYLILSAFSLACYNFNPKTKKLSTTAPKICAFTLTLCFWLYLIVYRLNEEIFFETGKRLLFLDMLWKYQYKLHHILGLLVFVFNFSQRSIVEEILKSFSNFDRHAQSLGWNFELSSRFYKLMIAQFCISSVMLLVECANIYVSIQVMTFVRLVAYFYIMEFYLLVSQQFAISASFVDTRVNALIYNFR